MGRRAATTSETLVPWGPILVGVGAVVGLLVTAFALPFGLPTVPVNGDRPPPAAAPAPPPGDAGSPAPPVDPDGQDSRGQNPAELDRGSGESRGGDRADPGGGYEHPPAADPDAGGRESSADAGDSAAGDLTADYRVITAFDDEFIAEVKISNRTSQPQDWKVKLRYPDAVGKLQVAWVESAPQAEVRLVDGGYVFSGTEPVAGRGSVALRVRFDRRGADFSPLLCTVNGADCAVT